MYPQHHQSQCVGHPVPAFPGYGGDWRKGGRGIFSLAIRRLTRLDPIFHVIYDLDQRYQVPGAQYLRSGPTYEQDGVTPRWRGIYDDQGRLMAAICHNMDLGDSWEHADNPQYDQEFSALGIRIGANYVIYAMTH